MARLPDHFDLWIRKARESFDPARQAEYVLGALSALDYWYFLGNNSKENPQPSEVEIENHWYKLVFSDSARMADLAPTGTPLPVIAIPTPKAMVWCLERKAEGSAGLLVNPGDFAALIPLSQLEAFHSEWIHRGGRQASGFWIPNMTSAEEDFWQQHGL